jgi:hypothetical protein
MGDGTMSHYDYLRARALHMRVRAAILQQGDEPARKHACDLEKEARELDRQLPQQDIETEE